MTTTQRSPEFFTRMDETLEDPNKLVDFARAIGICTEANKIDRFTLLNASIQVASACELIQAFNEELEDFYFNVCAQLVDDFASQKGLYAPNTNL